MLIFVSLGKMRKKPDNAMAGNATEKVAEFVATETLVAIPRQEAIELL